MILVKIKLDKSKIHGIGCFANQFIKKDQLVWKFDKNFDLVLKKEYVESLPIGAKENFLNYAYVSKTTGDYILCSDDSKFMNHSNKPNTKCFVPDGRKTNDLICFAVKDIKIDEEITTDYKTLMPTPLMLYNVYSKKMLDSNRKSIIFFIILFIMFMYSIFNLYNKYIVNQDFVYFLSEEEIPEQSDLKGYPE